MEVSLQGGPRNYAGYQMPVALLNLQADGPSEIRVEETEWRACVGNGDDSVAWRAVFPPNTHL